MTDAQSTLISQARAAGSSSAEAHALAFPSTTWENLTFDTGSQLPSESISRVFNSIDSNVAWQTLYESSSYANFDYNTQNYWVLFEYPFGSGAYTASLNSTTSNIKDKEPVSGSDYINQLHERLFPSSSWSNFSGMSGK
jgi:hypothetical protein